MWYECAISLREAVTFIGIPQILFLVYSKIAWEILSNA